MDSGLSLYFAFWTLFPLRRHLLRIRCLVQKQRYGILKHSGALSIPQFSRRLDGLV